MIKNSFIKSALKSTFKSLRIKQSLMYSNFAPKYLFCTIKAQNTQIQQNFYQQNHHKKQNIQQKLQIPSLNKIPIIEQHNINNIKFKTFTSQNSISILDKIKGNKQADNQQLLVLMFTCNICQQKAVRSFTKNAYQKGVVIIKCQCCQNNHLIADNLKWFQDEPTNVQTFSNVKKVTNSTDVLKILETVFQENIKIKQQNTFNKIQQSQIKI